MAALLGVVLGLAGCHSNVKERRWATCICDYVTDFDQPGHVTVEVCSDDPDPRATAEGCARGAGVGAITKCNCADRGAEPCVAGSLCRHPIDAK
jgi:hypothetical protein